MQRLHGVLAGMAVAMAIALGGCASSGVQASVTLPTAVADNSAPVRVASEWASRLSAGDTNGAVALSSRAFKANGFDSAIAYVDDLVDHRVFSDSKWSLDDAEVSVTTAGTATVYPIRAHGPSIAARVRLSLASEGNQWRVTGMDVEQY